MRNVLTTLGAVAVLTACGGGDSSSQPTTVQPNVEVSATPASVMLHPGDSAQLNAHASAGDYTPGAGTPVYVAVDFALQEADGGSLAAPVVDGENFAVTYTAPTKAGTYHVVASDHLHPEINSVITIAVN